MSQHSVGCVGSNTLCPWLSQHLVQQQYTLGHNIALGQVPELELCGTLQIVVFLKTGLKCLLPVQDGVGRVRANLESRVKKGKMKQDAAAKALGLLKPTLTYDDFKTVDMVRLRFDPVTSMWTTAQSIIATTSVLMLDNL
jgi:hypothetical protein